MKTILYTVTGEKKGEVELPAVFTRSVREDIAAKYFESYKLMTQFLSSTNPEAGKHHSASGTISHQRHDWKGHYGKGISRIPRKTMYRRGTQFFWIGAEVSSTRGGRQAHPPRGIRTPRKVNEKEMNLAFASGIASTAQEKYIKQRYANIEQLPKTLPLVIESTTDKVKTKQYLGAIEKICGPLFSYALRKTVRAGKGKQRGRKYKSTAGILIVKGKDETLAFKGMDIRSTSDLTIKDLYPLGRLTIFTQKSLEELKNA